MKKIFLLAVVVWLASAGAAHAFMANNVQARSTTPQTQDPGLDHNSLRDAAQVPQVNGTRTYCKDCNSDVTCSAGGPGAMAQYLANGWNCASAGGGSSIIGLTNPLTSDLNGNGHNIYNADVNGVVSGNAHGLIGDGGIIAAVSVSAGALDVVTVTNTAVGDFSKAKVGQVIVVGGAGSEGRAFISTIKALIDANNVQMTTPASGAVTGMRASYGTDNCTGWLAFTGAVAINNGARNWNPTGSVGPGIYMFAQCSQIVYPSSDGTKFFQDSLVTEGSGMAKFILAMPTDGTACGNNASSGAQFVWMGNYHAQLKGIGFTVANNNSPDCAVYIGHNPSIDQSVSVDIPQIETWGMPASTRTTGRHNPIGLFVQNPAGSRIRVGFIGGNSGGDSIDGQFRQNMVAIRNQNTDFDIGDTTVTDFNFDNKIFDDSLCNIDVTAAANNQVSTIRAATDGAGPNALCLSSTGTGDYRVTLFGGDGRAGSTPDPTFPFMRSDAHVISNRQLGDWIIPSAHVTVTGTCTAGQKNCTVSSVTGLAVNQTLILQGGDIAATVATLPVCSNLSTPVNRVISDNVAACSVGAVPVGGGTNFCNVVCDLISAYHITGPSTTGVSKAYTITAIDPVGKVLTFAANINNTPANGNWLTYPAYTGTVWRVIPQAGSIVGSTCITGTTDPAWPVNPTHNQKLTSGTCDMYEYGTGAWVDNNIQGVNSTVTVLGGQYGNGNPIGVLSRSNLAPTLIAGARFTAAKLAAVYCYDCSYMNVTGSNLQTSTWADMFLDSANNITVDASNNMSLNGTGIYHAAISIESPSTGIDINQPIDSRLLSLRSTVIPAVSVAGLGYRGKLVSQLVTCNANSNYIQDVVSDNFNSCILGSAPAGGGTFSCIVFCDSSAGGWKISSGVTPSGSIGLAGDATGPASTNTVAKVNGNTPGGTCTNQFTRSIDSSGRPTCSTITGSDVDATTVVIPANQFTKKYTTIAASAAPAVNFANSIDNKIVMASAQNESPTFTMPTLAANQDTWLVLRMCQPPSGTLAHITAWPTVGGLPIRWQGGSPPDVTQVLGSGDTFTFDYDGTNTYGYQNANHVCP